MYIIVDGEHLRAGIREAVYNDLRFPRSMRNDPAVSGETLARVVGWERGPIDWRLIPGNPPDFIRVPTLSGWTVTKLLREFSTLSTLNGQAQSFCHVLITREMMRICRLPLPENEAERRLVIVSGHGNFAQLVDDVLDAGWKLVVASFQNNLDTSAWLPRTRQKRVQVKFLDNYLTILLAMS